MKKGVLIAAGIGLLVLLVIIGIFIFTPSEITCSGSTPNKCNNQCYEQCGAYYLFECDNSSGGLCAANPDNCPPATPHSCNGTCWSCLPGQEFVCNASLGGTCKSSQ